MIVQVKIIPKSSQDKIVREGDSFKIKVTDAPEKGKANNKVIKLLAKEFEVPKSQIEIIKGLTKRDKLIKINVEDNKVTR